MQDIFSLQITLPWQGTQQPLLQQRLHLQVRYTLQVLYPVSVPEAVHRCDKQVLAKRDELRAFERIFTAAQVCCGIMCNTRCLHAREGHVSSAASA